MTHVWEPARYLGYADERGRPFVELLAPDDRKPFEQLLARLVGEESPTPGVARADLEVAMLTAAPAEDSVHC